MKSPFKNISSQLISILCSVLLFISCGTKKVSKDLYGSWISQTTPTTVRTKQNGKFHFTKGEAIYKITVHPDKSVSGQIGNAHFSNGFIALNWLMPSKMSGVAYTIDFDLEGKIFSNDPQSEKVAELWVGPLQDGKMDAELRYTNGNQYFPMADILFKKVTK